MTLPLSGNQLKKLTRRLRDRTAQPADRSALDEVLLYYADVPARAYHDVEALCADLPHARPMAPRVKTLKTTLEKLDRHAHLHSIAQIRDLAGLRVVVHGPRTDQDEVVRQTAELFTTEAHTPKLIDRRIDPREGYRAVHLEVQRDGILIEVQVRTELQHRWAEQFEQTSDKLGRAFDMANGLPTRLRSPVPSPWSICSACSLVRLTPSNGPRLKPRQGHLPPGSPVARS
ncbi:RelA/SpoT domain-containing protein [Solihabitans fulvus]|uniref:RelA/SpoT domain-containing protein n=1 Tax=Solihabitans fulvus TaxID=1892852 RepID=A0A5B2XM55_9PSEU|nr:RelA/SpoT domain-containing protein [Solihabitans fulvus]KAA2264030.1 RelA/SpoT domain-containing protein [Solihabitans fulvus]